jgi:hypothetical protein
MYREYSYAEMELGGQVDMVVVVVVVVVVVSQ